MDNTSLREQREKTLKSLKEKSEPNKTGKTIGIVLIVLALFIFLFNDMVYTTDGFLGIPQIHYTNSFWAFLVLLFVGLIVFACCYGDSRAKERYDKIAAMNDQQYASYLKQQEALKWLKAGKKLFGLFDD